jgi:hypothetical protein
VCVVLVKRAHYCIVAKIRSNPQVVLLYHLNDHFRQQYSCILDTSSACGFWRRYFHLPSLIFCLASYLGKTEVHKCTQEANHSGVCDDKIEEEEEELVYVEKD